MRLSDVARIVGTDMPVGADDLVLNRIASLNDAESDSVT